ncbi:hypothetical protein Y697_14060 [Mesotoga sp. BH458_6_3_2_1]|nr:hypothetical protein Y697_14060 [Mesotoga sp. BH458_6_3_2_1]
MRACRVNKEWRVLRETFAKKIGTPFFARRPVRHPWYKIGDLFLKNQLKDPMRRRYFSEVMLLRRKPVRSTVYGSPFAEKNEN